MASAESNQPLPERGCREAIEGAHDAGDVYEATKEFWSEPKPLETNAGVELYKLPIEEMTSGQLAGRIIQVLQGSIDEGQITCMDWALAKWIDRWTDTRTPISTQSAEATLPCPACAAASFNQSGQFEYECPKCRIAWLVQQKGATSQSAEAEAREIAAIVQGSLNPSGGIDACNVEPMLDALTRTATPTEGVEQALKELREMFPETARIFITDVTAWHAANTTERGSKELTRQFVNIEAWSETFSGATLTEAMAAVRAWREKETK